jgi:Xaa-Pro dipeptidase
MTDAERHDLRRADVEAKLAQVAAMLPAVNCEAAVLFLPAHVSWLCGGLNMRGLLADTERPGVFTNGQQRWLICSNLDTQRLFDEELDGLGFQLKEWQWSAGRASLLTELTAGKRIATDRPFPNMPLLNEMLRLAIRPLSNFDRELYLELGMAVAHAAEATCRAVLPDDTEREVAGHAAHRLLRHGVDLAALSVAPLTGSPFARPGINSATVGGGFRLQLTGTANGLYATAARAVSFGPLPPELRKDHDAAARLSAAYRATLTPGQTFGKLAERAQHLTHNTPYEFDGRLAQLGYGTGRLAAEELRRFAQDEAFVPDQAVVTQAKCGTALVADTLVVGEPPTPATPCTDWPYKRAAVDGATYDVPDVLVR